MKLNYNTIESNYSKDLDSLICQIDTKLATMAKDKLDSVRYDVRVCIDNQLFSIITRYRRILRDKIDKEKYLDSYSMEGIVSNIKQLITSGKIYNNPKDLRHIAGFEEDENTVVASCNYDNIIVKNNNSTTVINNNNNTSIIEQDNWDSIDW